ncbi:MAG TPA: hypothetical protein VK788_19535 [Terriglobales bacterium]|nr:hypothetical protein [Terriglobales bacterium]
MYIVCGYTALDADAAVQVTWTYATTRPEGYFYLAVAAIHFDHGQVT